MLSLSLYVDIEELEEGGLKNIASKAEYLDKSKQLFFDKIDEVRLHFG